MSRMIDQRSGTLTDSELFEARIAELGITEKQRISNSEYDEQLERIRRAAANYAKKA